MSNSENALRVGIFRGRFAPIHRAQVAAAKAFMEQMKLDFLFVVPAYIANAEPSDSALYRLRMCELAFEGVDGVVISDTEIKGEGKIGLRELLLELRRPETRLFLLCGTDEVLSFDKNEGFEEILSLCYPTYVRRENDAIISERIIAKISGFYKQYGVMFRRIVTDPIVLSSSQIRRSAAEGVNLSGMVGDSVARFIRENGLYKEGGVL